MIDKTFTFYCIFPKKLHRIQVFDVRYEWPKWKRYPFNDGIHFLMMIDKTFTFYQIFHKKLHSIQVFGIRYEWPKWKRKRYPFTASSFQFRFHENLPLSASASTSLDWIGVDSIFFDPVVPMIFYFKRDVEASLIIICIGESDVDNIDDAILSFYSERIAAIRLSHEGLFAYFNNFYACHHISY